jgi:hypothetical protein
MPNEQFSAISWTEQVTLQEDIDDGEHVDPLGHIILIPILMMVNMLIHLDILS